MVDGWDRYVRGWPTIPDDVKGKPAGKFWADPRVLELAGEAVARHGLWYASMPISNVCCERDFAKMRNWEDPLRQRLTAENAAGECLRLCNDWVVEEMLEEAARAAEDAADVLRTRGGFSDE